MNRSKALSFFLGLILLVAFGLTTDQILQNVYDSSNTALRTNLVAGGGGSGSTGATGPSGPTGPLSASAQGEITIDSNLTTTTLTSDHAWAIITSGWSSDVTPDGTTLNTGAGTITSNTTATFATIATLAFASAEAPNTIEFGIFKNNALLSDHVAVTWTDTVTFPNTVSVTGIDGVAANDVFDVRARSTAAVGDLVITVTNANFAIWSLTGAQGATGPTGPASNFIPTAAAIGSAPTCDASHKGLLATATDCNAPCTQDGTCTTGGSTVCPIYCDGSAWKEH